MKFIIILILILIIFFIISRLNDKEIKYTKDTFGHTTKNIKKILDQAVEQNNDFVIAEINRFHLNNEDQAVIFYERALQNAIFASLQPIILDRLAPNIFKTQPIIVPQEQYYDRQVWNDPQNVHDSNVGSDVVKKYRTLKEITSGVEPEQFMNKLTPDAQKVVTYIIDNPGYLEKIDDTDINVLKRVVERAEMYPDIYDALSNNLESCYKDGYYICTTGRVTNIIDALTLIDKDIGTPPITVDMIRKDVLSDSYNVIKDYGEYDDDKVEEIKDKLEVVLKDKYRPICDEKILDKLIEEAKAGI